MHSLLYTYNAIRSTDKQTFIFMNSRHERVGQPTVVTFMANTSCGNKIVTNCSQTRVIIHTVNTHILTRFNKTKAYNLLLNHFCRVGNVPSRSFFFRFAFHTHTTKDKHTCAFCYHQFTGLKWVFEFRELNWARPKKREGSESFTCRSKTYTITHEKLLHFYMRFNSYGMEKITHLGMHSFFGKRRKMEPHDVVLFGARW